MLDEDLKEFCRGFATWSGCTIQERTPDLWKVHLPKKLITPSGRPYWVLAFHRDLLQSHAEAQLVTPGSPVIQEMRDMLRRVPTTFQAWVAPQVPLPDSLPEGLTGIDVELGFGGVEVTYRTIARIHFRLVFRGAERREEFFPVFLDAHTGEPTDEAAIVGSDAVASTRTRRYEGKLRRLDEAALLEAAYVAAEAHIQPVVARLQETSAEAAAEERVRALAWFDATEENEKDPLQRAALSQLRERRLEDIDRRFNLDIELEPLSVVLYRIPVASVLVDPEGHPQHRFAVEVDMYSGQIRLGTCRHHGTTLDHVTVCTHHGVGCDECAWQCSTCRRTCCPDCEPLPCEICTNAHCQDCAVACATCGEVVARDHTQPCASGCGRVCPECVRLTGLVPRCIGCCEILACGHWERRGKGRTHPETGRSLCNLCAARTIRA